MEERLSKLIKRDSIAMVLYARFPSEMAYSHHIIQVAKGFVENNCDVNIYYPKTYNKKTLKETPEEYYGNLTNIRFIQINNVDITSFKIYEISPNFVKKFLFSLNTFIWAKNSSKIEMKILFGQQILTFWLLQKNILNMSFMKNTVRQNIFKNFLFRFLKNLKIL